MLTIRYSATLAITANKQSLPEPRSGQNTMLVEAAWRHADVMANHKEDLLNVGA